MNGFLRGLILTLVCTMGVSWGVKEFHHELYFFKNKNNEIYLVAYAPKNESLHFLSDSHEYILRTVYKNPYEPSKGKDKLATFEEIETLTATFGTGDQPTFSETVTLYFLKPIKDTDFIEDLLNVDHNYIKLADLEGLLKTSSNVNPYDKKFFNKMDYSKTENNGQIITKTVEEYVKKMDLQAGKKARERPDILKENIKKSIFDSSLETRKQAREAILGKIYEASLTDRAQLLKYAREQKDLFLKEHKDAATGLINAINTFISALYHSAKTDELKKLDENINKAFSGYNETERENARKFVLQKITHMPAQDREELAKYARKQWDYFEDEHMVSPEEAKVIDDLIEAINPTKTEIQKEIEADIYGGINSELVKTRKKSRKLALEKFADAKEEEKKALIKYAKKQEQLYLDNHEKEEMSSSPRIKNAKAFVNDLKEAAKPEIQKTIEKAIYDGINAKHSKNRKKARESALKNITDVKKQALKNTLIKYAKKQQKIFIKTNKDAKEARLNKNATFVKKLEKASKEISEA